MVGNSARKRRSGLRRWYGSVVLVLPSALGLVSGVATRCGRALPGRFAIPRPAPAPKSRPEKRMIVKSCAPCATHDFVRLLRLKGADAVFEMGFGDYARRGHPCSTEIGKFAPTLASPRSIERAGECMALTCIRMPGRTGVMLPLVLARPANACLVAWHKTGIPRRSCLHA